MVRWSELGHQPRVVARLRAALARDRVHHAYLFTGPARAGKRAAALTLAAALNCERSPGDPCGECGPCEKILAGIHPDVVTLEREGAAQLVPIETVRTQVVARVGLPPHEARMRVFLIDEATALAGPAANALLKTLEEPPARTMFILATIAPDQLLPTIRSRCQRVIFAAPAASLGGGAVDDDRSRTVDELAGELSDVALGHRPASAALTGRLVEDKLVTPLALTAAAQRLHQLACDQLRAGGRDPAALTRHGAQAERLLGWQRALVAHNANPTLAIDTLLGE
ncbi:MAG: AAA family ATPase, partial [Kofleriaceae bacterium]|nr:AAA family ATPase [Kofleriaceae bacterium]